MNIPLYLGVVAPVPVLLFVSLASLGAAQQQGDDTPQKKIAVAHDTTRIVEPLDEMGYVDYLAALNKLQAENIQPDQNFAAALWQVIGISRIDRRHRTEFLEAIGLDPETLSETDQLADLSRFLQGYEFESANRRLVARRVVGGALAPWESTQVPALAMYLSTNEKPLATLATALQREHFYQKYFSDELPFMLNCKLHGISEMKMIGRIFVLRAMQHLSNGDSDLAARDIICSYRVAGHLMNRFTEMEIRIAYEVCGWANEASMRLLDQHDLSTESLRQLSNTIISLQQREYPPASVLDCAGRWTLLELAQLYARYMGERDAPAFMARTIPAWFPKLIRTDHNETFRIINHWSDRSQAALSATSHAKKLAAINEIYSDLEALADTIARDFPDREPKLIGKKFGEIWVSSLFSDLKGMYLASVQVQAEQRLIGVAFAARLFEAQNERLPNSSSELVAQFEEIDQWIVNPFTNEPIQWERSEDRILFRLTGEGAAGLEILLRAR